jgi:hypothetical protein
MGQDEHLSDAKFVKVSMNIEVPWVYRQQLRKLAKGRHVSMNRLLVDALYSMIPPE